MSKIKITFISCCFNEEHNLEKHLNAIHSMMSSLSVDQWEILLIDDGSTDNTIQVLRDMKVKYSNLRYACLTRNFGKEAAICAGLDLVNNSEAAILIDADLQHPVETIPAMINEWEKGYDMVVATPKNRATSLSNKLLSRLYHKFISWSSKHDILRDGGDFRLISSQQINRIRSLRERGRYMKGLYSYPGGKISSVEYDEKQRSDGKSTFSILKRVNLAIDGITSLTSFPIRLFTLLGLSVLFLSIVYLLYILFGIIVHGKDVPGFASLLFSVVILNGLIMIQVGVQGEYIAQLLKEVKQRPIYVIDEESSDL